MRYFAILLLTLSLSSCAAYKATNQAAKRTYERVTIGPGQGTAVPAPCGPDVQVVKAE